MGSLAHNNNNNNNNNNNKEVDIAERDKHDSMVMQHWYTDLVPVQLRELLLDLT
jgi:hypothetical protein